VETATDGTGDWILDNRAFTCWEKSQYSDLLWLHGKPGSGKSTLLKRVVALKSEESKRSNDRKRETAAALSPGQEFVDYLDTDSDIIVAAFFYSSRGKIPTEMSHTLMLRSLLYQILRGNSRLFPCFQSKFRELCKAKDGPTWTLNDLRTVFLSLRGTRTPVTIYIIVDAMDESDLDGRPGILAFLGEQCSSKSPCVFKGLIASRPYEDIGDHLAKFSRISLQEENAKDIKTVIFKGVETRKCKIEPRQLEKVRKYLMDHSHGVFLWVSIMFKELDQLAKQGLNETKLEKLLRSLPGEVRYLYKGIIERLQTESSDPEGAKKMLIWTAFADADLTTRELWDAIVLPPSHHGPFTPTADFLSRERLGWLGFDDLILTYCGGLIEVRLDTSP